MHHELPEDIIIGRELLKKSEVAQDHTQRLRNFRDGVAYLNEYLIDSLDTAHIKLIKNLKVSYTRSLIKKLPMLEIEDFGTWFRYFILFGLVEKEVDLIVDSDLKYDEIYRAFIDPWIDEASEFIKRRNR